MKQFMIPYLHSVNKSHFVIIRWININAKAKYFIWNDLLFTVQINHTKNNVLVLIHDNYLHLITHNTFKTINEASAYIEYELSYLFNVILLKNCCVGDVHDFTLFELLRNNDKLSEFDSLSF